MFVILSTILLFGVSNGYLQGKFDPENHYSIFEKMNMFHDEVELTSKAGFYLGFICSALIEYLRKIEMKYKGQMKKEPVKSGLNFDDTEEERISLINMPQSIRRHDKLQSDSDEEEELGTFVKL